MSAKPALKRFVVAMVLGVAFGYLCAYLAGRHQPELLSLTHPIFWTIMSDRILIGLVVALAGAYTMHPVFGFPFRPWVRGSCLGMMVSIPLAAGSLNAPATPMASPWLIFILTLVSGGIYGLVIDLLATRIGGQGAALLGNDPSGA
ncbi:MAG: hypothetical protein HQL63_04800 [Magnetococcales bacterium]|nr:hypothetical protein [Magnetococcales bacterium]MBF0322153.1 hypothetical protein [Magnetococcales bacterium]